MFRQLGRTPGARGGGGGGAEDFGCSGKFGVETGVEGEGCSVDTGEETGEGAGCDEGGCSVEIG